MLRELVHTPEIGKRRRFGVDLGPQRSAGISWQEIRLLPCKPAILGIAGLHRAFRPGNGKSEATYLGGDSVL